MVDGGGDYEGGLEACELCAFEDGCYGFARGEDADGVVVGFVAAGVGGT